MKRINKVFVYIKGYWRYATLNVVCNILSALFGLFSVTMVIPFLGILFQVQPHVGHPGAFELSLESIERHFNYFISSIIAEHGEPVALVIVSVLIISMTLMKTGFRYLANFYMAPMRTGIVRDVRNKLYDKILRLPMSFFSEERKGDVISRITNDVQEVEWSIISSLELLFRNPIMIVIYILALVMMSYQLTIFVLVLLPVGGILIGRVGKNLKKVSFRGQTKMGTMLSVIEETLGGIRVIKAFNAEAIVRRRFSKLNDLYSMIMTSMWRRRYLATPLSEFTGTVIMVAIMWFGSTLVLNEQSNLSPQGFIAYLMMFYLIIEPAKGFSMSYYNVQKGLASIDRINTVLKARETVTEKRYAKGIESFTNAIEYRHLSFKYEKEWVLKDINLRIEKGKSIALVGQSGSGKSTLVDLLPRFHNITKGDILIDGVSINDYKIKDLRALMGNVNQDPILFNDTIFNNIVFGSSNYPVHLVEEAARVANAHDFIMHTDKGYHTNIGDRGNKLSGGQKQRLSIARAILKNPPILILDEATSALDTESERLVQDALHKLMKNRTSVIIAHRLSTVIHADEICVLHEGQIVERGKHKELLEMNGYYKKLHDMQMFS